VVESGFPLEVGDILGERYVLERVLGRGGMGVVFAARHQELRELVAIKVLHTGALRSPALLERFVREARLASRIKSDQVVRVLDVVRGRDDAPTYIVMEYLEGRDLGEMLDAKGPMPPSVAVDYVLQACIALAEAHRRGIVHRDVKPSNLLVTQRGDGTPLVKVLDFGISKAQEAEDGALTTTEASFGSPSYMSPEQIRSAKNVDARADVWALGVVLFELLSNLRPFPGDNVGAILAAVTADPPLDLRLHAPVTPADLCAVVEACLVKDREVRVASVVELAERLAPFASEAGRASLAAVRAIAGRPASESDVAASGPKLESLRPGAPATSAPTVAAPAPTEGSLVVDSSVGRRARAPLGAMAGVASTLVVVGAVVGAVAGVMAFRTDRSPAQASASSAPSPPAVSSPGPVTVASDDPAEAPSAAPARSAAAIPVTTAPSRNPRAKPGARHPTTAPPTSASPSASSPRTLHVNADSRQ
jgi:serine/threonine-protein kinase